MSLLKTKQRNGRPIVTAFTRGYKYCNMNYVAENLKIFKAYFEIKTIFNKKNWKYIGSSVIFAHLYIHRFIFVYILIKLLWQI